MDERFVGGLWCHQVLACLDALLDGELDEPTSAAVHTHVASCDACAAFGESYAHLVRALRAVPADDLDAGRLARLRRRVKAER